MVGKGKSRENKNKAAADLWERIYMHQKKERKKRNTIFSIMILSNDYLGETYIQYMHGSSV